MITYYVDCDAAGGGDGSSGSPYDSLSAAEAARNTADGQGGGTGSYTDIVRYLCSASSGGKDTADTLVNGGSQTSAYYLLVQAADGHRATAKWNSAKYGIELTSVVDVSCVGVWDDYVRVDGIQGRVISTSGNFVYGLSQYNVSASNRSDWTNCLMLGPDSDDTYMFVAYNVADADAVANIINCVGRQVSSANANRFLCNSVGTTYIYNCTFIGGQIPVRSGDTGTMTCRNVYAGGGGAGAGYMFYRRDTAYLYKTNCASSDSTADDTSAYETASNCLVNVALDATTFLDPLNATVLDRDFHLAGVGSDLYGAGVAPGGSDPLNYTTDINGDTIGGNDRYDIGADWWFGTPLWTEYTAPLERAWRYIQWKLEYVSS